MLDGFLVWGLQTGIGSGKKSRVLERLPLESQIAAFIRSNADNFEEILYEDFAIATCSGPRAVLYCSNSRT
jgi:hypothetical protein